MATTNTSAYLDGRRVRHRSGRPPFRGGAHARRAGAAGAEPARPVRALGQPGGEPARLHRGDLRPAAGRRGHPGAVAGGGADRDRGGHPARHGAARAGRAARRADRRARHGAAARAVRRPAVLSADRAQHPAVPRLGDLRAGDDRHRRPHPDARPAQVGVRPDRGGGHRPADDPAAWRHPGAAPVRHRRRARRPVLPVRAAHHGTRCRGSRTGPGPATGRRPTPWSPSPSRSRR